MLFILNRFYRIYIRSAIVKLKLDISCLVLNLFGWNIKKQIGKNVEFGTSFSIAYAKNATLIVENNVRFREHISIVLKDMSCMKIGEGSYIGSFSRLICLEQGKLVIENHTALTYGVILQAGKNVITSIGKNTLIAEYATLRGVDHQYADITIPISQQGIVSDNIIIGQDSWIGARVCILKGNNVGKHSIIGANSVVTSDIPDYVVAVGIPATIKSSLV